MTYSEKHLVLMDYFGQDDPTLIVELNSKTLEYNGDEYKVLDQEEFKEEIEWLVHDLCNEVDFYIDQIEIEMRHFMSIKPNKKVIEDEITDFYEDYIGTGTGEFYNGYYILLMQ